MFCSGEREIRDAADALEPITGPGGRDRSRDEVVPLYARLSIAEQHRVFAPHPGRRVVLATNVAETSLTVPGIRYVIDTGNARISRYSFRTKVQRLPIERGLPGIGAAARRPVRAARGRHLHSAVFGGGFRSAAGRSPTPKSPAPTWRRCCCRWPRSGSVTRARSRTSRSSTPPDRRGVRDGLALLHELGALIRPSGGGPAKLTAIGRQLTQLPIDPRLGRMVLEAGRLGCVPEVIVIAAALSIQDPRERPADHQQAADASHARFADPTSDFLGMLQPLASCRRGAAQPILAAASGGCALRSSCTTCASGSGRTW